VLIALFLLAAAYNAIIFIHIQRNESSSSVIPIVGGLSGTAGLLIWPYHDLGLWTWSPLLLDYGCAYYIAAGAFLEIRRRWRFRASACFARFAGQSPDKQVEIRLYKGGRLQLEETFFSPKKFGSFYSAGRWASTDTSKGFILTVWNASITIEKQNSCWVITQESGWFNQELCLAAIKLSLDIQ